MFFTVGMNFGIDFAGGTLIELRAKSGMADLRNLRDKGEKLDLGDVEVQRSAQTPTSPCGSAPARRRSAQQAAVGKLREAIGEEIRNPPGRGGRAARVGRTRADRHARRRLAISRS